MGLAFRRHVSHHKARATFLLLIPVSYVQQVPGARGKQTWQADMGSTPLPFSGAHHSRQLKGEGRGALLGVQRALITRSSTSCHPAQQGIATSAVCSFQSCQPGSEVRTGLHPRAGLGLAGSAPLPPLAPRSTCGARALDPRSFAKNTATTCPAKKVASNPIQAHHSLSKAARDDQDALGKALHNTNTLASPNVSIAQRLITVTTEHPTTYTTAPPRSLQRQRRPAQVREQERDGPLASVQAHRAPARRAVPFMPPHRTRRDRCQPAFSASVCTSVIATIACHDPNQLGHIELAREYQDIALCSTHSIRSATPIAALATADVKRAEKNIPTQSTKISKRACMPSRPANTKLCWRRHHGRYKTALSP